MKPWFHVRDLALAQAWVAGLAFLLVPAVRLLGIGPHKLEAALHGAAAGLTLWLGTWTTHKAYSLLKEPHEPDSARAAASMRGMERMLWALSLLILLSIASGNWLYIAYRAPDGPQQWLTGHAPAAHSVVMEFKELAGLFPLPLTVAAAWALRRFRGRSGAAASQAAANTAVMLAFFAWVSLVIAFALGYGLALLKPV